MDKISICSFSRGKILKADSSGRSGASTFGYLKCEVIMKNLRNLITALLLLSTVTAFPMKRQQEGEPNKIASKRQKTTQHIPQEYVRTTETDSANLVKLSSKNGDTFILDLEIANKSATIKNMIEDLGTNDQTIPLANMDTDTLLDVISCLQDMDSAKLIIESLEIPALHAFILACNFLEIPELLNTAIEQYADRCTSDDALAIFQSMPSKHFSNSPDYWFPDEIKREVIHMIVQKHGLAPWVTNKIEIEQKKTLSQIGFEVYSICVSPDGQKIVSGSTDRNHTIKICDLNSGNCLHTLNDHTGSVWSVCISPDGQSIVSGSADHTIKIWNLNDGMCTNTLNGHAGQVVSVCISPDGQNIVSGSSDGTIKIWTINDGTCIHTIDSLVDSIDSVCISPDGQKIVSSLSDRSIKIWSMNNGTYINTINILAGFASSVCISPDGQKIVSASSDGTIKIWNINDGTCIHTIDSLVSSVSSICISPDGQKIVSGSYSNTIKIWDINSGKCINTCDCSRISPAYSNRNTIISICYSPDGEKIISASTYSSVWDVSLITKIEKMLNNVTLEQALALLVLMQNEGQLTCHDNTALWESYRTLPREVQELFPEQNPGEFYCSVQ